MVGEFENMLPLYFVNASGMTTIISRAPAAMARSIESGTASDLTSRLQVRNLLCGGWLLTPVLHYHITSSGRAPSYPNIPSRPKVKFNAVRDRSGSKGSFARGVNPPTATTPT
jgi:hypothetical protein